MKGRLIKDTQGDIFLLCNDGAMVSATKEVLYSLLFDFSTLEKSYWASVDTWKTASIPDMSLYPGETLAFVTEQNQLIIMDSSAFSILVDTSLVTPVHEYISLLEYAKKYDKSKEIIKVYCRNGRISGAIKVGKNWMIPKDAPYPVPSEKQREGVRGPRGPRSKKH